MTRKCLFHIGGNQYSPLPAEHHTFQIWEELSKGFDEYHVFARSKNMKFSHTQQGKIHLHLIPGFGKRMWVFFFLSWLLPFYIHRYKPTHLLAQCPVMGGGVAALCALIYKIPLFVELHGTHYFMPSRQGVLGALEHIIYRTLAKPVFTIATTIRSLSGDMTSSFVQVYGKKLLPKIVMIPVRVDLNIFPPKENYKLHQPLRVVNVGKLSANKNQIQLVNHLKNSKMPIEIILVGSGEQEADLKCLISTLPSHIKVTLKGQVTHTELCDILQQSDIFIHYALSEGTPRAIIEAMAVGLPVIVTSAGFMKDILIHQYNALIIERPESDQLLSYIEELANAESVRIQISKAGQTSVLDTYEWNAVFDRYRQSLLNMTSSS